MRTQASSGANEGSLRQSELYTVEHILINIFISVLFTRSAIVTAEFFACICRCKACALHDHTMNRMQ